MRVIPIIFSAPMIRALLDGRKTQTRRLAWRMDCGNRVQWAPSLWQRVQPGDRLWVREVWKPVHSGDPSRGAHYQADVDRDQMIWRTPIHMPRWASRLTLTVTATKIERLQDMSEADALAEGVQRHYRPEIGYWVPGIEHPNKDFPVLSRPTAREMFAALWDVVHGSGAWQAGPDVVALTFTVEQRNIDAGTKAAA